MNRIEKERNNLCIQLDRIISEQLEKLLGQDNLQMKRISWEDDSFDIIEKVFFFVVQEEKQLKHLNRFAYMKLYIQSKTTEILKGDINI